MKLKDFLKGSGAAMIAILGVAAATFPLFAVFLVAGWIYLKQEDKAIEQAEESTEPETKE